MSDSVCIFCFFWGCVIVSVLCQMHSVPSHSAEEHPVRLVSQSVEGGRVELYFNGTWYTVCNRNWDEEDAQVVCRQMGFQSLSVYPIQGAFYGQGNGPIKTNGFNCKGGETDLVSCPLAGSAQPSCTHEQDVGVLCKPNDVPVRLVGGTGGYAGRVELFMNGEWGTVCDRNWDVEDARVVCAQLGFQSGQVFALGGAFFGEGQGGIYMDNVNCKGVESHLVTCPFSGFNYHTTCTHRNDAGVICSPSDIPMRLVGNSEFPSVGLVQMQLHGDWGTVCDNSWDEQDAEVVCRQLGFNSSRAFAVSGDLFGHAEGPIFMDRVNCNGGESHLTSCTFSGFEHHTCTHQHDAGVVCIPEDLPVRLVGVKKGEGRVEIQLGGQWGTVCDDYWDEAEAKVVCRQLGFRSSQVLAIGGAFYGQGSGPILMDDAKCVGNEAHLSLCPFNGFGHHTCTHAQDAGVNCLPGNVGVRLTSNGEDRSQGRVELQLNGTWGTVCDRYWDREDAEVVCRSLGYDSPNPLALTDAFFGQSSHPIYLNDVNCGGGESHLTFCPSSGIGQASCAHDSEAGVICQPRELPVRLASGGEEWEGRVEMKVDGEWGTICDSSWDKHDAQVVCRQLGFNSSVVLALTHAFYGEGTGRVLMSYVECARSEPHLALCHSSGIGQASSSCTHQSDAGVICKPLETEMRLVGKVAGEGRVELKLDGKWSTICASSWGNDDAAVVCRSMGFNTTIALATNGGFYGQGDGPVVLRSVDCAGTEAHVLLCPSYYGLQHQSCDHTNDAGVMCHPYQVRLAGGASAGEGRVEVLVNGEWGTICDDYLWGNEEAQVVCRQLGFNSAGAKASTGGHFGQGSGPIPAAGYQCTGTENSLAECPFSGFGEHSTCDHTSDAGVICA